MIEIKEKQKRLQIINTIKEVLTQQPEVIFAYLYGSFAEEAPFSYDIDIGAYCKDFENVFAFQFDMKVAISKALEEEGFDIGPDEIDFRVINDAPFDFATKMIEQGILLVDKDTKLLTDYIEHLSMQNRINEIVLKEAYR